MPTLKAKIYHTVLSTTRGASVNEIAQLLRTRPGNVVRSLNQLEREHRAQRQHPHTDHQQRWIKRLP